MIGLLTALIVKHFVFDFAWQPPFMWQNKGKFGHWGGLVHSGVHAFATYILLLLFIGTGEPIVVFAPVFEFIIHYFVDYFKMNINKNYGWACNTHNEFWQLTGLDQMLHYLTYVLILIVAQPYL